MTQPTKENPASNPEPRTPNPRRAESALVVFAKAPIPGEVKTRLCPPLTPDEAATLHGTFVLDVLEQIRLAASPTGRGDQTSSHLVPRTPHLLFDRYLACSPASDHVFFKIMEERQGVQLLDQVGPDLGARMSQTFTSLFARGYKQVVIIGTDAPTLPPSSYQEALASLNERDLVLGPALDGGYYLIGLTRPAPELFAGVPWSTDQVLPLTRKKAADLGLTVGLLKEWRDVDTIDDLRWLIDECAADATRPRQNRIFSMRTAGTLLLLAKLLPARDKRT
jgi:hypothetical protein